MMKGGTPSCRYFAEKLATISRLPRSSTWWMTGLPESPTFFSPQDRLRALRAQRRIPGTTPIMPRPTHTPENRGPATPPTGMTSRPLIFRFRRADSIPDCVTYKSDGIWLLNSSNVEQPVSA